MKLNIPGLPFIVQQAFNILLNKGVGRDNLSEDVTDKLEEVDTKADTPHGNEAHNPEFETPAGAQAKVDAHSGIVVSAHTLIVNATVPGAGWYRIARVLDSTGRGNVYISVYSTGGTLIPQTVDIKYHNDWATNGTLIAEVYGGATHWNAIRLTNEDGNRYIEIYFKQAISDNMRIRVSDALGYPSTVNVYSDELPAGGGTVFCELPLKLGLNTTGYVNAAQYYLDNTRKDDYWDAKPDLGETSSTAYRGDRGKTAYDHSQVTGTPHVTDTEKTTWNGKPNLGETSATAYRGDRGKTAYDHSQVTGAAHGAVSTATASRIILRDSDGRAKVTVPNTTGDIATGEQSLSTVSHSTDTGAVTTIHSRQVNASTSSTASSSRSQINASAYSTASNNNSQVNVSHTSTASGMYSQVNASVRTINNQTYSMAGGYASLGDPSTANRKWHIYSNPGSDPTIQIATTLQSNYTFGDYGEYFESIDGQEIPAGYIVALDGDKIRKATISDKKYLGVISKTAGVILGGAGFCWQGRYLRGEFGEILTQEIPDPNWEPKEGQTEADRPMVTVERENPDYNPKQEYIARAQRPEWHIVGLLGQVHVRIDDTVQAGDYIKSNNDGIGTKDETKQGWYVMKITIPYDAGKGYGVALCLVK